MYRHCCVLALFTGRSRMGTDRRASSRSSTRLSNGADRATLELPPPSSCRCFGDKCAKLVAQCLFSLWGRFSEKKPPSNRATNFPPRSLFPWGAPTEFVFALAPTREGADH